MTEREELRIDVPGVGTVSALLRRARDATVLLVLGHGAGAGMRHAFLEAVSEELAARGVATLRYNFPYAERGKRRPDPRPTLLATARAAVAEGARRAGPLPVLAGGRSMGGRMTSSAAAEGGWSRPAAWSSSAFPSTRRGAPPSRGPLTWSGCRFRCSSCRAHGTPWPGSTCCVRCASGWGRGPRFTSCRGPTTAFACSSDRDGAMRRCDVSSPTPWLPGRGAS